MNETPLTREKILEVAEDVLLRYGPSKATVIDVARALGVSHGSVYRHFASKAELRNAVLNRWLTRLIEPLESIVRRDASAEDRLYCWLKEIIAIKRQRLEDVPELFAAYVELSAEAGEAIEKHMGKMIDLVRRILAEGVSRGEFQMEDSTLTARAILIATSRFHHPAHKQEWASPSIDADFEAVWALLLNGLTSHKR